MLARSELKGQLFKRQAAVTLRGSLGLWAAVFRWSVHFRYSTERPSVGPLFAVFVYLGHQSLLKKSALDIIIFSYSITSIEL